MNGRGRGGGRGGITREQPVQPANFGLSMTRGRGRGRGHSAIDFEDQAPMPRIHNGNDAPWSPVPLTRGRGRGGFQLSAGLDNMEPVVLPVATRGRGNGRGAWGAPPALPSDPLQRHLQLSGDVSSSGTALNASHPVPRGGRGELRYSEYCVAKTTAGEPEPIRLLTPEVDDVDGLDQSQPTALAGGTEPQQHQGGANAASGHCPQCGGDNNNSQAMLGIIADFIDALSQQFGVMSEKIALLTGNNHRYNGNGTGGPASK